MTTFSYVVNSVVGKLLWLKLCNIFGISSYASSITIMLVIVSVTDLAIAGLNAAIGRTLSNH